MKSKCFFCNKKIKGLVIITCECGNIVCMNHINKHSHSCKLLNIDKSITKNKIKKENPSIEFKKLEKI
jgi:hypothetical protein